MGRHVVSVGSPAARWAPLPTLAVGWAGLAHVLSFRGLALWVVLGSLAVLITMRALLAAGRRLLGLLDGAVLTILLALLANLVGGDDAGPLARATLLACGLTAAATALAFTRFPMLLVIPALAMLGSALALGAAGQAGVWVGLWVVAAAATAAMLGPYARRDLAATARLVPLAAMVGGCGLVSVAVLAAVSPLLGTPRTIPGTPGLLDRGEPPAIPAVHVPGISLPPVAAPQSVRSVLDALSAPAWPAILGWLLVALLGVALVLLLRRILSAVVTALRWSTLRRRLRRGTAEQRVVGAWTYLRLRRESRGDGLPASASPDVAASRADQEGDQSLARIARLAAEAAFNPNAQVSDQDADAAWQLVRVTDRGHRHRR